MQFCNGASAVFAKIGTVRTVGSLGYSNDPKPTASLTIHSQRLIGMAKKISLVHAVTAPTGSRSIVTKCAKHVGSKLSSVIALSTKLTIIRGPNGKFRKQCILRSSRTAKKSHSPPRALIWDRCGIKHSIGSNTKSCSDLSPSHLRSFCYIDQLYNKDDNNTTSDWVTQPVSSISHTELNTHILTALY